MNFLRRLLRAIDWQGTADQLGAGAIWLVQLLGTIVSILLTAVAQGVATVLRSVAPYLIGSAGVWYTYVYQPELFNQVLTGVFMVIGFLVLVGRFRPKKRKR